MSTTHYSSFCTSGCHAPALPPSAAPYPLAHTNVPSSSSHTFRASTCSVLKEQKVYQEGNVGQALKETFHGLDDMIDSSEFREELGRLGMDDREGADGDASGSGEDDEKMGPTEAIELFQKLLSMQKSGKEQQEESPLANKPKPLATSSNGDAALGGEGSGDLNDSGSGDGDDTAAARPPYTVGRQRVLSTSVSSIDPMTGKQMCTLPDHPIHAGCTSVVAVIADKKITVGNAGDSRAVLKRKVNMLKEKNVVVVSPRRIFLFWTMLRI